MGLGLIPHVPDLPCDHTAQQRKPQIGSHGLGNADPVIARRAFHRLIALVDDHADRLVVGRIDGLARGVMAVPCPVRAPRNTDRINAKPIARRFHRLCRIGRIKGDTCGRRHTILQQHKRTKHPSLPHRRCGLARVVPAASIGLIGLPHIPKLSAGEHISTLGHTGDVGFVYIGGRVVHPLELFKGVRPVHIATLGKGIAVERGFGEPVACPPCWPLSAPERLLVLRGERAVVGQIHIGGDHCNAKAGAKIGVHHRAVFDCAKPCGNGQPIKTHIRRGARVRLCIPTQKADVVGNDHRSLGRANASALGLGVHDPVCARFIRCWVAGVFIGKDKRRIMPTNARGWRIHRIAQVRHDQVDTRRQGLGLLGAQVVGQTVHSGVAHGGVQHGLRHNRADPHHRGIAEISEGFQVIGAVGCIGRHFGFHLVHQAIADRIHHRLMIGHGIDQMQRIIAVEGQGRKGRQAGQIGDLINTRQALQRVRPQMNGSFFVGKEAVAHLWCLPFQQLSAITNVMSRPAAEQMRLTVI